MLNIDQLKRLQKAGCPMTQLSAEYNEKDSYPRIKIADDFQLSPTVEDMMGWMGTKIGRGDDSEKTEIILRYRYGYDDCYRAGSSEDWHMIVRESEWFPDALSALYDLFEKLEAL